MRTGKNSVPRIHEVENRIFQIRGKKVMLDSDLAGLYGVPSKSLNLAVKRNLARFPEDFMFRLTRNETEALRFQIETSKKGRGGRRYLPYVFTEQGISMLSSVLNSERAILVNIQIIRAFVQLRRFSLTYVQLKRKIDLMESKYDAQFKVVFDAIKRLLTPVTDRKKTKIGFH